MKLKNEKKLATELTSLLNKHCQDIDGDTSDFILTNYLIDCLKAYNKTVKHRDKWWGVKMSIGGIKNKGKTKL